MEKMITVDSQTSRDLDDGFSIEKIDTGWILAIYIATPALSIPFGGDLYNQAKEKVTSIYSGSSVKSPMLPPQLSEGELSLLPGTPKTVMKITLQVTLSGNCSLIDICTIQVINIAKLNYDQISPAHHPSLPLEAKEAVMLGLACAKALFANRLASSNCMAYSDEERGIYTNEEGIPSVFSLREIHGHILIQEFMIATNIAIAEYALNNNLSVIYRNHEKYELEDLQHSAPELHSYYSQASAVDVFKYLNSWVRKADYGTINKKHAGLGVNSYVTITSPLRRFVDLYNQYVILNHLNVCDLPATITDKDCEIINQTIQAQSNDKAEQSKYVSAYRALALLNGNSGVAIVPNQLVQIIKRIPQVPAKERAIEYILATPAVQDSTRLWATIIKYPFKLRHDLAIRLYQLFLDKSALSSSIANTLEQDGIQMTATCSVEKLLCESLYLDFAKMTEQKIHSDNNANTQHMENYKGKLFELCMQHKIPNPTFDNRSVGSAHLPLWVCSSTLTVKGDPLTSEGRGVTKKDAEQKASAVLLESLRGVLSSRQSTKYRPEQTTAPADAVGGVNHKGKLLELLAKNKISAPQFHLKNIGTDHAPTWSGHVALVIYGSNITATGSSPNKKAAEQQMAASLLRQIELLP